MKQKLYGILSIAATALILLLTVLQNAFDSVYLFAAFNSVISPLALIAALVCGCLLLKDTLAPVCKWSWVVLVLVFALALKSFAGFTSILFQPVFAFRPLLRAFLFTGGYAFILLTLLWDKLKKFLPIGFLAMVIATLLGNTLRVLSVAEALFYIAMAALTFDPIAQYRKLLRTAAVALAVICLSDLGLLAAVCWCVLAYILAPPQKLPVSFRKLTAVLCVLAAALSLIAYFTGEPLANVTSRNLQIEETKEDLASQEEWLLELQTQLQQLTDDLAAAESRQLQQQAALAAAETACQDARQALELAELELDTVCSRDYYSWRCKEKCEPYHAAVEECNAAIGEKESAFYEAQYALEQLTYQIESLGYSIDETEASIRQVENNIVELEAGLSELKARRLVDVFEALVLFGAMVLSVAALGCLGVCLYTEKEAKYLLLSCGGLALGALLYIAAGMIRAAWQATPLLYLLRNPYTWSLALTAFLAVLFAEKTGKRVLFRVLIIAAALLTGVLAYLGDAPLYLCLVYAAAMICLSLVLVPTVFTEYNTIAKHLFFSFVSAGIWQLIWLYHVTGNLNKVSGVQSRKPVRELLLCLFLPFYYTYWLLKTGENVELYGKEHDVPCKLDVLCLVFAFVCPLMATVLIQNKINQIVGKPE